MTARVLKNFLENNSPRRAQRSLLRQSANSFEATLSPAVNFALKQLRRIARPAAKKILASSAWRSFGQHLAERLAFALTPTLRLEQSATKAVDQTNITLLETFRAFPGALEIAAQLIGDWIDAQEELLNRLARDQRILRARFLGGRKKFRITAIHPGVSDPHDGGKTVTVIKFSRNGRVIYKPRTCEGEQSWFAALRWLDRNGLRFAFRAPDLVSRKNYSWMEFLEPRGCRTLREVRLFYSRWGAQAAVAQILGASDLHRENWLAVGSQPVLVDAELIADAKVTSRKRSLSALLDTGLLPLTPRDGAGSYRGIAPLDAMLAQSSSLNCWPRYKGKPQPPWKYVGDIVRGFEAAAEIFAKPDSTRNFSRAIISRSTEMRNARAFFRSSAEYARLLRESLEPYHMISQAHRRRWLVEKCCASSLNRPIGLAEARALLRCDLPKFATWRKTVRVFRKQFSASIAQLMRSSQLLRRRVLLGARARRR